MGYAYVQGGSQHLAFQTRTDAQLAHSVALKSRAYKRWRQPHLQPPGAFRPGNTYTEI